MTNHELCGMMLHIAEDLKTLYVMGGFGFPLDERGKTRAMSHEYNRNSTRREMIVKASADTFAFDCVGLVKSVLWGFKGNTQAIYGGAKYASNGVPDCNITHLYNMGSKHSTDMSYIAEGEFLVLHAHHCGVYVGNGLVVESTPSWKNKVQVTKLNQRNWKCHCYLPYVRYEVYDKKDTLPFPDKTDLELAREVIRGKYGNGVVRKAALGDRYEAVQKLVNSLIKGGI